MERSIPIPDSAALPPGYRLSHTVARMKRSGIRGVQRRNGTELPNPLDPESGARQAGTRRYSPRTTSPNR